jgi:hypothetical protein
MKKIFAICAGFVLAGGAMLAHVPSASAQDQTAGGASSAFKDVPVDHWAYAAVGTLQQAGIVIGYPDGTYGGRRAMTRYEFAVAIARLLNLINTAGYAKSSDLDALKQDMLNRLQQNSDAIDALKALVNEFQPELQALGQDVAAIKSRLDDDEKRLAAVEAEQRRVKISGEVNFIGRGNINTDSSDQPPLDENGYRIGSVGNKSLWSNVNVYQDILLNITGRVSDNAQAVIKIDAGNALPFLGNGVAFDPFRDENAPGDRSDTVSDFSVYEAYLDSSVSLGPLSSGEVQLGRFPEQLTALTLKGINPDVYTDLPETSSGDIPMDGAKLMFGVGPAHVQIYGAKNDAIQNFEIDGGPNPIARSGFYRPGSAYGYVGAGIAEAGGSTFPVNPISQSAAARVTWGTPDNINVGITGLIAQTNNAASLDPVKDNIYNNLAVYGADGSAVLPFVPNHALTIDGEVAVASTGFNSRFGNVNSSSGNEAWDANLGYAIGPLHLKAGYKEVYAAFAAPGYWGRIGSWTNPTNVKGPVVSADYAITPSLSASADGSFYKGGYDVGFENPLGKDDDLNAFDVGLKYGLTAAYNLDLGYSWDQYNLKNNQGQLLNSGKPTEQYITLGVGHSFSPNASIKLMYQIIDYKDKDTGFDPAGDSKGGVALTQVSLKF